MVSGDEWIEVVIINDLTAAQLEAYFIGDSTSSTAAKFSGYQFTNMSTLVSGCGVDFPAGTIIVVGGAAALTEDTSYDPANGDWTILLRVSGTFLTNNGSVGDLAGSDVIYIDTDGTNGNNTLAGAGAFAVNYDSSPGTFGGNASVTVAAPNNNSGVVFTGDNTGATTAGNYTDDVPLGSMTLGAPNGGTNTTYINGLQTTSTACPEVPTLSEWGLINLAILLMTFGTLSIVQMRREPEY